MRPDWDATPPSATRLVRAITEDIAAGDFTHRDGSRYVMLVNKNLQRSVPCIPQFRDPVKKVELVSPYTGQLVDFAGEQIWLAPGQGALLKLSL